ncbi:MAG TPA: chloride channel protein [Gemmatimonadaceae bacterium]
MSEVARTPLNAANGLPVAPSLEPALEAVQAPPVYTRVDRRVILISALAIVIGAGSAVIASVLTHLIGLFTNIAYFGHWSWAITAPSTDRLGILSIGVPVIGGIIVGFMARYGAAAIRGHGIPEVMERVLYNKSVVSPRIMFLKPVGTAIAIGTGGPFGAEGPIIATGGALGSLIGQIIHVTADERKTLLAAGAAAGMAAIFNSPVSAVLLAVELLLFEYRPRSLIPVAFASAAATGLRSLVGVGGADFGMPPIMEPTMTALGVYVAIGILIGLVSVFVTRWVYWIEDLFEELPIHWMWWPAIGAVAVGLIGLIDQRTLGVGYQNISQTISGQLIGTSLLVLVVLKFLSWSIYLGSGTAGGTLAPLFTIGGGAGALIGGVVASVAPSLGVDPHIAALVGMAGLFAGASHALLAAIVFTFEVTRQPIELLPLLASCSAAYLISLMMMRSSIMTEKLARRGTNVPSEYAADYLERVLVRDAASQDVVTVRADQTLTDVRAWLSTRVDGTGHQGFPVLNAKDELIGVVTRRDLLDPARDGALRIGQIVSRVPVVVFGEHTLREAADHMVHASVGRLPVVKRESPRTLVGIVSRSDLLAAHRHRLDAALITESPPIGRGWLRRQARISGKFPKVG